MDVENPATAAVLQGDGVVLGLKLRTHMRAILYLMVVNVALTLVTIALGNLLQLVDLVFNVVVLYCVHQARAQERVSPPSMGYINVCVFLSVLGLFLLIAGSLVALAVGDDDAKDAVTDALPLTAVFVVLGAYCLRIFLLWKLYTQDLLYSGRHNAPTPRA